VHIWFPFHLHFMPLSLSLSLTHTHTHSLSNTYTHTHVHSHVKCECDLFLLPHLECLSSLYTHFATTSLHTHLFKCVFVCVFERERNGSKRKKFNPPNQLESVVEVKRWGQNLSWFHLIHFFLLHLALSTETRKTSATRKWTQNKSETFKSPNCIWPISYN